MINLKSKRRLVINLVIIFAFIIYLFCANTIVTRLFLGDEVFQIIPTTSMDNATDVQYFIDVFELENNILCSMNFAGWFIIRNQYNNGKEIICENQSLNLILKNNRTKEACSLPLTPTYGSDIVEWLRQECSLIEGMNFRTTTTVSTITIPNGIYDVWIQIVDTNQNERFVKSPYTLNKNGVKVNIQNEISIQQY